MTGARSPSSPPANVLVTPITPTGSFASPESAVALASPSVVPLATQPPGPTSGAAPSQPPLAVPLAIPTNVPTASMAAAYTGNDDPLVGKTLVNRYLISRKLGEGGMGSVYLASHIVLEKQVALKVLHGEYARKPDLVERFMQEAKAASRIRHENVIDISDFGVTEDGFVFFAMELLKGNDLHELVARARLDGQVLPWDRSRHIFLQICAALAAAHSHGIVHRDLKPENIYLIEFLGRPDFVKLLDFGIAKLSEPDGGERKLTRTGMLFGTPEYMSPEQARGDKVDHRVDIYAMACILFQLLTGRVPFEAENFMGVLSLHLTEPPPEIPPAALERCGAPREVAAIVARGLSKKPADRWQTIEDMAHAIRSLGGEVFEEPQLAPATIPPRTRTQWTGVPEIPLADEPARSRSKLPFVIGGVVLAAAAAVAGVLVTRSPAQPQPQPIAQATPPAGGEGAQVQPVPPGAGAPTAVEPEVVPPPPAPPPPALPEKVTITFALARGATLYGPDNAKLGDGGRKGREVVVELPGGVTALAYRVRGGKGTRERVIEVIPDRDLAIAAAPDSPSSRGSDTAAVTPGATDPGGGDQPVQNPGGDKPEPSATPDKPADRPADRPADEDDPLDPKLKPFENPAGKPQ
jgi:eukaryotic-like serine/threonine-protein kinase